MKKQVLILLVCIFPHISHANGCVFTNIGIDSQFLVSLLQEMNEFICKANKVNPELRILNGEGLKLLKTEGTKPRHNIYALGRSAAFEEKDGSITPENRRLRERFYQDTLGFINQLSPEYHNLIGGGTDSGFISLFHRIAFEGGFNTVGLTSLKAIKYEPAPMTHFYAELQPNTDGKVSFGDEIRAAIENIDAVFMMEGGGQSIEEAYRAIERGIPIYIVYNEHTISPTTKTLYDRFYESFKSGEQNLVQFFKTGTDAGMKYMKDFGGGAETPELASRFNIVEPEDISKIYPDVYLLGFSTWANNPENMPKSDEDIEAYRTYIQKLLDHLDPEHIAISVAGTINRDPVVQNGEEIVIEEASKRGFRIIATPARSVRDEQISDKIDLLSYVSNSWRRRTKSFVQAVNALVTAGSTEVFLDQLQAAKNKDVDHLDGRMPFFNIAGFSGWELADEVKRRRLGDQVSQTFGDSSKTAAAIINDFKAWYSHQTSGGTIKYTPSNTALSCQYKFIF